MAISCVPSDLAEASKCFCFDNRMQSAVEIYLLMQIAGLDLTPKQLADAAVQFQGIADKQSVEAVKLYLLCQAATAAGA